jgi:hypothetical protein
MVGVASQIIFCIFAAAVIGSMAGYLIGKLRHGARSGELERVWKSKLDQRDGEIAALRDGIASSSIAPGAIASESVHVTTENITQEIPERNVSQFEDKLSEAVSLIEKLARSQERMENELVALRKGDTGEFRLEPSTPKA